MTKAVSLPILTLQKVALHMQFAHHFILVAAFTKWMLIYNASLDRTGINNSTTSGISRDDPLGEGTDISSRVPEHVSTNYFILYVCREKMS